MRRLILLPPARFPARLLAWLPTPLPVLFLSAALALCGLVPGPAAAQSPVWALRGAHNTVYLAESVHLLKPDAASLPPAFERAWADSSQLVMEMDLGHLDPTALQGWMQQHGRLEGGNLLQVLGARSYADTVAAAVRLGLSSDQIDPLKPWVVALVLTELSYQKQGFDPDSGVERQLLAHPDAASHPTAGLETIDQELGQLDGLPLPDQARFLQQTLEDLRSGDQDTADLVRAWRAGDTATLARMLSDDYQDFPTLYDALLTQRNQRWLPQIQQLLRGDHNVLVVVGALHVVGRGGLLDLARKAGIRVEPVN